jgi:8-oxo-dGTP pyrophosphatase MutT (NUDIX family)
MRDIPEARPASTVVLLRDGRDGMETLLLKRNKALMFAGGFWVFPGGSLDPEDLEAAAGDEQAASRIAAAREAKEESGLEPRIEDMVLLSHWTTPIVEPKRFSTWIYAAPVASGEEVMIDGGEIHDSRWIGVREALKLHGRGELGILPPTFVNLLNLSRYDSVADMLEEERVSQAPALMPVISAYDGNIAVMFPGDAGYESGDPETEGARHRAVLVDHTWQYQYSGNPGFPNMVERQEAAE